MSISTRRLSYVLKSKTQIEVSKLTGIPQSTISRVQNNQIPLPPKYTSTLRNYYQKTAYSELKSSGASATQANRFAWYIPETVSDVVQTLNETREMLSTAWVARLSYQSEEIWDSDRMELEREKAQQTILETMQKSKKTIEDIYGSGKKSIWTI